MTQQEQEKGSPHAIPEISNDTIVLKGRLARLEPGEVITYEDLTALIGRDVRHGARSNLMSARNIVERERNVVLASVYKVGIKRLEGKSIPSVGDQAVGRIRRSARRAAKRMTRAVMTETMDAESMKATNARISMLGALAICAQQKKVEKIESETNADVMSFMNTLKMFE